MEDKDIKQLTLGSLFDGSGGFPLGGCLCGIKPIWASEIEPFPIAVTTKRFPDMKHLGDVSKLKGSEIEPVDIITFGSPCFPAGTLVLTDKGYIEIENIQIGDKVLTHEGRYKEVTATGHKEAETIVLIGENQNLECTSNHPIYTTDDIKGRDWVAAENMKNRLWATPNNLVNSNVEPRLIDDKHTWYKVTDIVKTNETKTVYNLTVADDNSYIADGIVVHNCQDLSLAGRRAGLEGARSSLFYQATRIIKEMMEATNGKYPKYAVWENVPGAFSSNDGEDFRAVLEAFCSIKQQSVSIPKPDKWVQSGEILGDDFSIAWRLLDAQYWGVPSEENESFLSQILQTGVQDKYYLSQRACQGILQRCSKRGKILPEPLKIALEKQADI